jgi:N-acyl-D-amino-acid deacylase
VSFDLIISGAQVYPGDGPPVVADVAIEGSRIAAIGRADGWEAREHFDGHGMMLCPGFIDLHSHSGLRPFADPLLSAKTAQGFTTELINPDGLSPAPVSPEAWPERLAYLRPIEGPGPESARWGSVGQYLAALEEARPATSLVACVAHNAVREHVMGRDDRAPSADELERMRAEVRSGLEAGTRCLSFGLIYVPGMFARTDELVELATEAARLGAPLVPHVRNEGAGVLEAVGEMIEVARRSGAALHLSHLKVIGNGQLVEPLLALIDAAARDIDLTFDQYPYGAGSTTLAALLPPWAQAGGRETTLRRLSDPGTRRRIAHDIEAGIAGWENICGSCGPDRIVIVDAPPTHDDLIGRSLAEVGERRGTDPIDATMDVLCETALAVTMVDHYATEDVVRRIFVHPRALVSSDGIFGPRPHPRLHATAARVLGRYALRERLISVEEAVGRLTARPADLLGLSDRGRIREGLRADLVLLDPASYVDTATYDNPTQSPPGVAAVFVGGRAVNRGGQATAERPGEVVRAPRKRR